MMVENKAVPDPPNALRAEINSDLKVLQSIVLCNGPDTSHFVLLFTASVLHHDLQCHVHFSSTS